MAEKDFEAIETDITQALMEAAQWRLNREVRELEVIRKGKKVFSFRVQGLDEDVWDRCRRNNTRNRGKRNEELDNMRYVSQLIYEATIDEDKYIWQNRELWKKFNVATSADFIWYILTPEEKSDFGRVLETLSCFNSETEDTIKN